MNLISHYFVFYTHSKCRSLCLSFQQLAYSPFCSCSHSNLLIYPVLAACRLPRVPRIFFLLRLKMNSSFSPLQNQNFFYSYFSSMLLSFFWLLRSINLILLELFEIGLKFNKRRAFLKFTVQHYLFYSINSKFSLSQNLSIRRYPCLFWELHVIL